MLDVWKWDFNRAVILKSVLQHRRKLALHSKHIEGETEIGNERVRVVPYDGSVSHLITWLGFWNLLNDRSIWFGNVTRWELIGFSYFRFNIRHWNDSWKYHFEFPVFLLFMKFWIKYTQRMMAGVRLNLGQYLIHTH